MTRKLAIVFPGQGSQAIGMLADLAAAYPAVTETFDEASAALGYDLWRLCQEGPESELNRTERTQPAMLTADVAVWRVWRGRGGPAPAVAAGHSLGEYAALVCAGSVAFTDAVQIVAERGRLMQEAVPEGVGAVAAILGLDDAQVRTLCEAAAEDEVVCAVNFNAPGQVVIAGHATAVDRALEGARAAGAKKAVKLPLSVPVHSPLMQPAAERFAARLAECAFAPPSNCVFSNVDLAPHRTPEGMRENLAKQLYSPVPWSETVAKLVDAGAETVVECGPGRVLAGLNRRIARRVPAHPVFDPKSLEAALEAVGDGS